MNRIEPGERVVSHCTIDSHIQELLGKIEAAHPSAKFIHSVYGVGCKFEQPCVSPK